MGAGGGRRGVPTSELRGGSVALSPMPLADRGELAHRMLSKADD